MSFCKGPFHNILGFAGHMVSVATMQLCHYRKKKKEEKQP
jgi:hypothetical protein